MPRLTLGGKQILPGCEIFGVHHSCEGCPNLKEMGDGAYNATSIGVVGRD